MGVPSSSTGVGFMAGVVRAVLRVGAGAAVVMGETGGRVEDGVAMLTTVLGGEGGSRS